MYVCVCVYSSYGHSGPYIFQEVLEYSIGMWKSYTKKKKEGKVLHFNRGRQKITIKIVNIECGVC